MNEDSVINSVSGGIIKTKTEVVFYSDAELFVVPKEDEQPARNKLEKLNRLYPDRKLKIISVEDFEDLLNRRNVIDIQKQKIIVRSAKFALKNWAAVLLFISVIGLLYFGRYYDFDTNPAILVNKGYWLSVQNKNGKELWKRRMVFNMHKELEAGLKKVTEKIGDIDSDGTNEIILTREEPKQFNPPKQPGRIACYSSKGEQIWEYYFRDTVKSVEMVHSPNYASNIIDTLTINNVKTIACFSTNVLYPSAVYFLNLKNGKRTGPTMWHTGHLHSGKIRDFNNDGKRELVMFGLNNAYRRAIVFSVDIDKIGGQLPTYGIRKFVGLKNTQVNNYLLLPITDYTLYLNAAPNKSRNWYFNISDNGKRILNYLYEGKLPDYKGILIKFDGNLNVTKIDPSLEFESARDSLVVKGKLNPPLTHTKEYQEILYNSIRYWDGEKFIKKEEYKNKIKAAH